MDRRGSQGKSSYDLLSWSNAPANPPQARGPVRNSATNNSQGYTMANDEHPTEVAPVARPAIRILQPSGASQIHFGDEFSAALPKQAADSIKQRELSGSQETFEEQVPRRPMSNAKAKEMSGSNIFGTEEASHIPERRRSHDHKAAELSGNGIFEPSRAPAPAERALSDAKRREMFGNNIFSEDKKQQQQQQPLNASGGRVRKPPDVVAKIQQFAGSNPAQPDEAASAECVAHPKKISDKHISDAKIKEMNGTYDLFDTSHTGNVKARKSEKQQSGAKRQEISGNYDLLSYDPDRHDSGDYVKCTRDKPASESKLKELGGSYVFGDCYSASAQQQPQQQQQQQQQQSVD